MASSGFRPVSTYGNLCYDAGMKLFVLVSVLALLLTACGGAATVPPAMTPTETPTSVPTPVPTDTLAPSPTSVPAPTPTRDIISSLKDVRRATIQIEAEGSFVDLELGQQLNRRGRGSGFIIDPSGIAVTNNHVVTGAAILRVWIGGEGGPHNAKILGVSECSDLAVIDIDGEIYAGIDVFTAGFPLGDPEFTLTKGVVSKTRTRGETNWASVDFVIEHDATINPGNSWGPLVTPEGEVVGVNYAGSSGTGQFFAISREEALKVIDQLRAGDDVNSIGVNGTAVRNVDEGLSGIWVASVKSGSPASNAKLTGGDIITKLEGLVLATDGTKADYCDILRTHHPEDVLKIEVLRFATGEVLEGKLNSNELRPISKQTTEQKP